MAGILQKNNLLYYGEWHPLFLNIIKNAYLYFLLYSYNAAAQ